MHSADDFVICLGDIHGLISRHIDRLDVVHGAHGVGQRNMVGRMLLQFCLHKELSQIYGLIERKKCR